MIETLERIEDPVAWTTENIKNTWYLENNYHQVISGDDLDVVLRPQTNANHGRLVREVSPLLGSLYMQGVAYGIDVGDITVYMEWYPSPSAANRLSEEMDLNPGVDVLRFVHSDSDVVRHADYEAHLKNGEYPQSTGGTQRFSHDRDNTHAVGVYFMPEYMFANIQEWKNIKKSYGEKTLPGIFDSASYSLPGIIQSLINNEFDIESIDKNLRGIQHIEAEYLEDLLGIPFGWYKTGPFQLVRGKISHAPVLEKVTERYLQLKPKIDRLQNASVNA